MEKSSEGRPVITPGARIVKLYVGAPVEITKTLSGKGGERFARKVSNFHPISVKQPIIKKVRRVFHKLGRR